MTVTPAGAGFGYEIQTYWFGSKGLVVGDRITSAPFGVAFDGGSTGKYRDNLTSDVATPFTGGTDAGNNN